MAAKETHKVPSSLLAIAVSIGLTGTALAQDATLEPEAGADGDGLTPVSEDSELAPIVVTARKREENLMTVPVAVSVMSDEAIDATGVKDLNELSAFTPGLATATQGIGGPPDRSRNRLIFRGLSTSFGSIFIDGSPYTGTNAPDITDVARVEVLTGPQSVYFGRSTFSGAVNYVTKTPSNHLLGMVSGELGTFDRSELRASVEGPLLGNALTARISVRRYEFDGQYSAGVSGLPLGAQKTTNGSIALASEPAADFKLLAYYSYSKDSDGPPPVASVRVVGPGPTLACNLGGTVGPYYCGALPDLSDLDPRTIGDNVVLDDFARRELVENAPGYPLLGEGPGIDHFGLERRVHHAHGRIDYETGSGWQFGALAAYTYTGTSQIRAVIGTDTSAIVNPFRPATPAALAAACNATPPTARCFTPEFVQLAARNDLVSSDASGEIRVSSPSRHAIRGTLGASYFTTWGPPTAGYGISNGGRLAQAGGGGTDFGVKTPAVFGGFYADVTDRLTISAEARYQWDRISQQAVFPTVGPKLENTFKSFAPRLTANFQITPQSLIYATYSRGYQPGGFNTRLFSLPPSVLSQLSGLGGNKTFEQEKLDNFEFGHKSTWFDNHLRTTLALYAMKWANGQVTNTLFFTATPESSAGSLSVVTNVGKVDLRGLEFTADLAVSDNLTISSTADYNDSEIKDFVYLPNGPKITGTSNVNGNRLDHVSKLRITVSPTYRVEHADGWSTTARVDYLYRSKYFIDPTNTASIKGSSLINARLSFESDYAFKFDLFVNNLLDDDTVTEGVPLAEGLYAPNPAVSCPPCFTAVAPPTITTGVSAFNAIFLGLPRKRTWGAKATMRF